MLAMPEDRGAAVGLVCPDALEDPGAVVEAVAQYVDLGVVPRDEIAIHPDPLRLLHGSSLLAVLAKYALRVRALQTQSLGDRVGHFLGPDSLLVGRSQARRPEPALEGRVDGDLDRPGLRVPAQAVAKHHRRRQEGRERVGDA